MSGLEQELTLPPPTSICPQCDKIFHREFTCASCGVASVPYFGLLLLATVEADYWECSEDADRLTHEHPVCALEYHFDELTCRLKPGSAEEQIRAACPIQIWPWHRKSVPPVEAEGLAEHAMASVAEMLDEDEDYGDLDGTHEIFGNATLAKHLPAFTAAVEALLADADVWACERGNPVTLTANEVIQLLREHCPEWFEEGK